MQSSALAAPNNSVSPALVNFAPGATDSVPLIDASSSMNVEDLAA